MAEKTCSPNVDMSVIEEDGHILYSLTTQVEWYNEQELYTHGSRDISTASFFSRATSATQRNFFTFFRKLGVPLQNPTPCSLPDGLLKLMNVQINWSLSFAQDGSKVAILKENAVEIRSNDNGFEKVTGIGKFGKDPHPQWRHVTWNPDCSILVCSQSNGIVLGFDAVCTKLFTITGESPTDDQGLDLSRSVASLLFTDRKPESPWLNELLVITYNGNLASYFVNREGCKLVHSFFFGQQYPFGICTAKYLPTHKILLLGGCGEGVSKAQMEGLTAWRVLSGSPYYQLVTDLQEDSRQAKPQGSFIKALSRYSMTSKADKQDGIFKMSVSPDNTRVATLSFSGALHVWHIPSLKLFRKWTHEEQPDANLISPDFLENPERRKSMRDLVLTEKLVDADWWDAKTIILSRGTGAVLLSSTSSLKNLLGASPEWFEPATRVTGAHNEEFLALEVECKFPQKRNLMPSEEDDCDNSEDEGYSWITRTSALSLFRDKIQTPKRRARMVSKTYRLVSIKSTTPEELYTIKIQDEEFGEALRLAQTYNLDSDLVYQKQWRNAAVSKASIQDYLSRIKKRAWVLQECLHRMPENIDGMRDLLEFGLCGTDVQALIEIGNETDGGRFMPCDPEEDLYDDLSFDEYDLEGLQQKEKLKQKHLENLLQQVDFQNLNLEQKELCRVRRKLLQYLDRLNTYELILGGERVAAERFNARFFQKFRDQNIVETAIEYAKQSDFSSLEILMTYHGNDLRSYRLDILSSFPETTPPEEYKSLLPEIGGTGDVLPWKEISWRIQDWSEDECCSPQHKLLATTVTKWYIQRACEIEEKSGQVDNALELVKIAIENGVMGLERLLKDFTTMETIVYECLFTDGFTFACLQKMSDYEQLELIMSKSSLETYSKNIHRWLVPFLQQCEKLEPGAYTQLLEDYMQTMAKNDLSLCQKIFEASKPNKPNPIIKSTDKLLSLAINTCYTCERDDQLDVVFEILQCLPKKSKHDSVKIKALQDKVDCLENNLRAGVILKKYGIYKPMCFFLQTKKNEEDAKLLIKELTSAARKRSPAMSKDDWLMLQNDMLLVQDLLRCLPVSFCLEIFAEALLCSGRNEDIVLAAEVIECAKCESSRSQGYDGHKIPYDKAVQLVVNAAQEYFDSSSSLNDPCIEMARTCLHLMKDQSAEIQEELDLIDSLAVLRDFEVSLPPKLVRSHDKRLELMEKAITSKPGSFKQQEKLLRLGKLLHVEDGNKGEILQLIAATAIKERDNHYAFSVCVDLMQCFYGEAWAVCVDLAWQENFHDFEAKVQLLSFAVTYCTPDMIEPILKAKLLLETQVLYSTINMNIHEEGKETKDALTQEPQDNKAHYIPENQAALFQTKNMLTSISKSSTNFISQMADKSWWQSALKTVKQPLRRHISDEDKSPTYIEFAMQGGHLFYGEFIDPCIVDTDTMNLNKCCQQEKGDFLTKLHLLRTILLEEVLTEGEKFQSAKEILLKLAEVKLSKDTSLGLSFLLALHEVLAVENIFKDMPLTSLSLQVACYYYCLQIYAARVIGLGGEPSVLYTNSPLKLIEKVQFYVNSRSDLSTAPDVVKMVTKLKHYSSTLADFIQAKQLESINRGVDIERFAKDVQYREETICGMALSLDGMFLSLALSMAEKYKIDPWHIYMNHLGFLFSDSGLKTDELEKRIHQTEMLAHLTKQTENFVKHMMLHVYPVIDGKDHSKMLLFYSLLLSCGDVKLQRGMNAESHITLLKKLKMCAEGLDYSKLMESGSDPLEILSPILKDNNFIMIAKLAAKIPDNNGKFLQPSQVYCEWAIKSFWKNCNKKLSETKIIWPHGQMEDILLKLTTEDLTKFVDHVVFSKDSITMLSITSRLEVMKRVISLSQQQAKKSSKKEPDVQCWNAVCQLFLTYEAHLKALQKDAFNCLQQFPSLSQIAERFDLSKGNSEKLKEIFTELILKGEEVALVVNLIGDTPVPNWSLADAVQNAINIVISQLRKCRDDSENDEILQSLQKIVKNIVEHQRKGGEMVTSEDVMIPLRPFVSDSTIAVKSRLNVLHILEKSIPLSTEDCLLLIMYRTKTVVENAWPEMKVTSADIESEEKREDLFKTLLKVAETIEQRICLCELLHLWPSSPSMLSSDPSQNLWIMAFENFITSGDKKQQELAYKQFKKATKSTKFHKNCVFHLYDRLDKANLNLDAVKLALFSKEPTLFELVLPKLKEHKQPRIDNELLRLFMEGNLLPELVSTVYYVCAVDYILQYHSSCKEESNGFSVLALTKQLNDTGHFAEAGSLLLKFQAVHPMLQTFGVGLKTVQQQL